MTRHPRPSPLLSRALHRRDLFRLIALGAGATVLAGCERAGDNDEPTPGDSPGSTPAVTTISKVVGYDNPTIWEGQTLTVTSWGGEYQGAQERAIFEPFQRLTGAMILTEMTDIPALRDQVESKDVTWDVCDVLLEDVVGLANLGAIEELDYNVIDADGIFDDVRMDHAIGSSYYSTLLAFQLNRWESVPDPSTWADFWNLDRYPGTRGFHQQPQTTLEFALLADGVPLNELYPLDVDRAFAMLGRIRDSITLWWEQGAQPTQILTSGDLDMTAAWHSRVQRVRTDGAPVGISWNGGALSGDAWVIPKGSANREVAMDFINFATRPEVCAAFSSLVPFGPVNRNAFDYIPQAVAELLPSYSPNKDVQFTIDFEWWFNQQEELKERFDAWLTEHP